MCDQAINLHTKPVVINTNLFAFLCSVILAANIDLLTHLSKMSGTKVLRADFQNEFVTLVAGGQKLEGNLTSETRGKLGPYEWHGQAIK